MNREPPTPAPNFSIQLSPTPRGARLARLLATEQLRSWGLPLDPAALIVAELAANAVVHGRAAGRDFRLTLYPVGDVLRIEVTDTRGDRLPERVRPAPDADSGRGLLLVDAFADRWGTAPGPAPRKTVWAEVRVGSGDVAAVDLPGAALRAGGRRLGRGEAEALVEHARPTGHRTGVVRAERDHLNGGRTADPSAERLRQQRAPDAPPPRPVRDDQPVHVVDRRGGAEEDGAEEAGGGLLRRHQRRTGTDALPYRPGETGVRHHGPEPVLHLGRQPEEAGKVLFLRRSDDHRCSLAAEAAVQEWPSSAVSSSPVSGTEPESRAGRSGKGSTRVSSMTGAAGCGGLGMTAASEWPPQP